jgi:ketosteroid isomerase-like protein
MAENIAQTIYETFGRGDLDAFVSLLDEDITWRVARGAGRGAAAFRAYLESLPGNYPGLTITPDLLIDDGDTIVVLGTHRFRNESASLEVPFAHVWSLSGGKVSVFAEYYDPAGYRAALPLLEGVTEAQPPNASA